MKGKIIESLKIEDIADEGRSVARHNGLVIFVDKALPGDVVDIQITRKHKSYLEGKVVKLISPSPYRTQPFCKHFGTCGGCKWQHMQYEAQLFFKQKQVLDAMQRIAKIDIPAILPILASEQGRYYRNKLDYSFADKKWLDETAFLDLENNKGPALGYHLPGRFDRVLDIEECYLQPDPSDSIRNEIKNFAISHNLSFMNLRHRAGLLRSLIIRNTLKGEWMVILTVYENRKEELMQLLNHVDRSFPGLTSILYIINPKANDSYHDLEVNIYKGREYITEEMEGLQFRIGAKSFFQTNPLQTLKLYSVVREFAGLTGNENVYDLYTGTGTIANFVASACRQVTGIDYVPDAINDAKTNSLINGIANTTFLAGDMKDLLTSELFQVHGNPDVIITDPPRAGMHYDVVECIASSHAKKIVYVSCNPGTQARDLSLLHEKYDIEKMQPVDMFPHTAHVENVALLTLKH